MCRDCQDPTQKTLMCFACCYVGCTRNGHIARHFREDTDHRVSIFLCKYVGLTEGIDTETGNVFCHMCDDFIYDPTFETIQRSKRIILGKRKRDAEHVPIVNGTDNTTSHTSKVQIIPPRTCKSVYSLWMWLMYSRWITRNPKLGKHMLHVFHSTIIHS